MHRPSPGESDGDVRSQTGTVVQVGCPLPQECAPSMMGARLGLGQHALTGSLRTLIDGWDGETQMPFLSLWRSLIVLIEPARVCALVGHALVVATDDDVSCRLVSNAGINGFDVSQEKVARSAVGGEVQVWWGEGVVTLPCLNALSFAAYKLWPSTVEALIAAHRCAQAGDGLDSSLTGEAVVAAAAGLACSSTTPSNVESRAQAALTIINTLSTHHTVGVPLLRSASQLSSEGDADCYGSSESGCGDSSQSGSLNEEGAFPEDLSSSGDDEVSEREGRGGSDEELVKPALVEGPPGEMGSDGGEMERKGDAATATETHDGPLASSQTSSDTGPRTATSTPLESSISSSRAAELHGENQVRDAELERLRGCVGVVERNVRLSDTGPLQLLDVHVVGVVRPPSEVVVKNAPLVFRTCAVGGWTRGVEVVALLKYEPSTSESLWSSLLAWCGVDTSTVQLLLPVGVNALLERWLGRGVVNDKADKVSGEDVAGDVVYDHVTVDVDPNGVVKAALPQLKTQLRAARQDILVRVTLTATVEPRMKLVELSCIQDTNVRSLKEANPMVPKHDGPVAGFQFHSAIDTIAPAREAIDAADVKTWCWCEWGSSRSREVLFSSSINGPWYSRITTTCAAASLIGNVVMKGRGGEIPLRKWRLDTVRGLTSYPFTSLGAAVPRSAIRSDCYGVHICVKAPYGVGENVFGATGGYERGYQVPSAAAHRVTLGLQMDDMWVAERVEQV